MDGPDTPYEHAHAAHIPESVNIPESISQSYYDNSMWAVRGWLIVLYFTEAHGLG